jgi:hypothetical protein
MPSSSTHQSISKVHGCGSIQNGAAIEHQSQGLGQGLCLLIHGSPAESVSSIPDPPGLVEVVRGACRIRSDVLGGLDGSFFQLVEEILDLWRGERWEWMGGLGGVEGGGPQADFSPQVPPFLHSPGQRQ